MKKRLSGYKLSRSTAQRGALLKGLIRSLVAHEEIVTTVTKAKAVTPLFERLLTQARTGTVAARRAIASQLQSASLIKRLVDTIAPRYQDSKGGYTSLTKIGPRRGDNAVMVKLALTKKSSTSKTLAKPAVDTETSKKKVVTAVPAAPQIEKVAPVKAAPKLVRRTGKRGDK